MYRSILVPLDGSTFGEHALPIALGIARRTGATLHLVHVHVPATISVPAGVDNIPYVGTGHESDVVEQEQAYLESITEQLGESTGVRITTEWTEGLLTEKLRECAEKTEADLVVVCTHAHEGVSRLWHTGVGEQLLRECSTPILLIHPEDEEPDRSIESAFRHILVPLNGSAAAERVLSPAVELARALDAQLTLLRVVRPQMVVGYTLLGQDAHVNHFLLEREQSEAHGYLTRIAERLRAGSLQVNTRVLVSEDPGSAILEYARAGDRDSDSMAIDLIALTTHCRASLSRVITAGVADEILHNTFMPVLLEHAETPPKRRKSRAESASETEPTEPERSEHEA